MRLKLLIILLILAGLCLGTAKVYYLFNPNPKYFNDTIALNVEGQNVDVQGQIVNFSSPLLKEDNQEFSIFFDVSHEGVETVVIDTRCIYLKPLTDNPKLVRIYDVYKDTIDEFSIPSISETPKKLYWSFPKKGRSIERIIENELSSLIIYNRTDCLN